MLSRAQGERTVDTEKWGLKTFFDGEQISCYLCHNGPSSSQTTTNANPSAQPDAIVVGDQPVPVTLLATDPNGDPLEYRIVKQPNFGRVGLSGNVATYIPDPGYAGTDLFSFAAWDGKADSNLAGVVVTRLASWNDFGSGYPGTGGVVPQISASGPPSLGSAITIDMENTAGVPTPGLLVGSTEYALIDTPFGGTLLTEPKVLIPITIGAAGQSVPLAVPSDMTLIGVTLHTQTVLADAGAPFGIAFTPVLRLTLGY